MITVEVALSGSPIFVCRDAVEIRIIPDVDRVLEQHEGVISGDAIILNRCISWLNIMPEIVDQIESAWKIRL